MKHLNRGALIGLFLLAVACTSVPPESVTLSRSLGERLAKTEQAHIALVEAYFIQKQRQIDDFVMYQWLPYFAESFFSNPQIDSAWQTIISENSKQDRLDFILKVSPALLLQLEKKKQELNEPIQQLKTRVIEQLSNQYQEMQQINQTLTLLLLSASDLEKVQYRHLESIGVTQTQWTELIIKTDKALNSVIKGYKKGQDLQQKIKEFVDKIDKLREGV